MLDAFLGMDDGTISLVGKHGTIKNLMVVQDSPDHIRITELSGGGNDDC